MKKTKKKMKSPTNSWPGDRFATRYVRGRVSEEIRKVHRWNRNNKGWDKELEGY